MATWLLTLEIGLINYKQWRGLRWQWGSDRRNRKYIYCLLSSSSTSMVIIYIKKSIYLHLTNVLWLCCTGKWWPRESDYDWSHRWLSRNNNHDHTPAVCNLHHHICFNFYEEWVPKGASNCKTRQNNRQSHSDHADVANPAWVGKDKQDNKFDFRMFYLYQWWLYTNNAHSLLRHSFEWRWCYYCVWTTTLESWTMEECKVCKPFVAFFHKGIDDCR